MILKTLKLVNLSAFALAKKQNTLKHNKDALTNAIK